jgi:endonuclease/exonuclease/phosphatase family metal-dependent hydrolase
MPLLRLLFATLALSACSSWAGAVEPPTALRVRVLTYNIHHGEGVDGKLDLARIAKVITAVEPDLVSVQEVDQKVERTGKVDQPAELERLTKMHAAFGGNLNLQGGHYGNLVLSRWPIARHRNHPLPSLRQGEPRGVLEVEVELPGDAGLLTFLATHLDHRPDESERLASAEKINEIETKPLALLAGDLNAVPESKTLSSLGAAWTVSNQEPMPTIPVDKPTRQIDYVLFKPAARWKVVETRVLDEAVASDHRALLAVLELLPEGAR